MDILQTRVQTSSAEFQSNRARMETLVAELDERLAAAPVGGGRKPASGTASRASSRYANGSSA